MVLILTAFPVWSAEAPRKQSRRDSLSQTLEPIIVTAEKREQNLREIPASITSFSQFMIEDAGISDIKDLVHLVPNLHMKQGAATNLVIMRGISNDADFIHSTTGFYVDDVAYTLNFMHNPNLFDVERIEVLRGPQGTLYGKNSESGVVNVITRQPDDHFFGKVYSEIGTYDFNEGTSMSYRTGFSLSSPVVENRFFLGAAGEYETSEGYITNTYTDNDEAGDIDHKIARMTARWTPSDRLEMIFSADITENEDGNGNKRYLEGPWASDIHEIRYNTDNNIIDQSGDGQTLKAKYNADNFTILSITARRFHESNALRDGLCSPVDDGINDIVYSSDLLSQEIRISSPDDSGRFEWIGGIYLFTEDNVTDITSPVMGETRNTDMETQGYAVFGQGTLTLAKRLHLTLGLRAGYDDMKGEMDYYSLSGYKFIDKSFNDTVLLPKFAIAYDLTPDIMTYASITKGYNAGGFNTPYAEGLINFVYDAEYSLNYEIGAKSAFWENRLFVNLALFHITIDDKQVPELDGVSDAMQIRNAAEAYSQGFELELQAKPFKGVDLFAGVGYTNVEFDQWQTPDFDYEGNKLPNAPEFTGTVGVQYRHTSGFFGRADLIMSDDYYTDARNSQKLDGKTLVNLRIGYEGQSWEGKLWCKNLFNEEYQTGGFARRFDQVVDGQPRHFGIILTYYF